MRAANNARGDGFFQSQLRLDSDQKRLAAAEHALDLRAETERKLHSDRKEALLAAQSQARNMARDAARDSYEAKLQTSWAWKAVHGDLCRHVLSATQKNNVAVHRLVMAKGVAPISAVEMVARQRRKEQADFEAMLVQRVAAAAQSVAAREQDKAAHAAATTFFDDAMQARAYPPGWSTPLPTGYYDRPLRNATERAAYKALQGRVARAGGGYQEAQCASPCVSL